MMAWQDGRFRLTCSFSEGSIINDVGCAFVGGACPSRPGQAGEGCCEKARQNRGQAESGKPARGTQELRICASNSQLPVD